MCCDWPPGGLAVAVLLSGTGRLQTNTSVENVLTSTAAPIRHWGFVCVRRRAGEGGNNVYWLRAGGQEGSWCCRLAPPPPLPPPGSVRLRSFDLEWPLCVYIFPKCSLSSSCLCLS